MTRLIFILLIILLIIFLFIYFIFANNSIKKILMFESFNVISPNLFDQKEILKSSNIKELGDKLTIGISGATSQIMDKMESTQQSNLINNNANTENLDFSSFIIFEDKMYAIGSNNAIKNLYCSYLNYDKWFKLVDNPSSSPLTPSVLLDIVILRSSNDTLFLIALYDKNLLYIKDLDDVDSNLSLIDFGDIEIKGSINQIISSENLLFMNIKRDADDDEEDKEENINSGIHSFNITTKEFDEITFSTSYSKICINQYNNTNNLYGLFLLENNAFNKTNICVKKNINIGDDSNDDIEYNSTFLFEKDFIDLFITDDYLYGLTNNKDKYIYRKSINKDIASSESFLWYKVSSIVNSFLEQMNSNGIQNKIISIYDGYIYCIINKEIKKQKINGFEWISFHDKEKENQYYPKSAKTIINKINTNINKTQDLNDNNYTNSSIINNINFNPNNEFKFSGLD